MKHSLSLFLLHAIATASVEGSTSDNDRDSKRFLKNAAAADTKFSSNRKLAKNVKRTLSPTSANNFPDVVCPNVTCPVCPDVVACPDVGTPPTVDPIVPSMETRSCEFEGPWEYIPSCDGWVVKVDVDCDTNGDCTYFQQSFNGDNPDSCQVSGSFSFGPDVKFHDFCQLEVHPFSVTAIGGCSFDGLIPNVAKFYVEGDGSLLIRFSADNGSTFFNDNSPRYAIPITKMVGRNLLDERDHHESQDFHRKLSTCDVHSLDDVEMISNAIKLINEDNGGSISGRSLNSISYPASANIDQLLQGFSINKVNIGAAFEPIKECEGNDVEACIWIEEKSGDSSKGYNRKISSESSMSNFLDTVVNVEGGSVGTRASGSIGYIGNSEMTTTSVSYMIGSTQRTDVKRVKNPLKLKLTDTAATLLKKNPTKFLQLYGYHFIDSITYGGSFIGSFTLNAKSKKQSSSLKTEAAASYDSGIYDVKGSAKFQQNRAKFNSDIDVSSGWSANRYPPGSGSAVISVPEDLGNLYTRWMNFIIQKGNGVPVFVNVNSWYASEDVQNIVNAQNFIGDAKEFQGINISPNTMHEATKERSNTKQLIKILERYLSSYPKSERSPATDDKVNALLQKAKIYYQIYTGKFNDAQLLNLDLELRGHSPSGINHQFNTWKLYQDSMKAEFDKIELLEEIEFVKANHYLGWQDDCWCFWGCQCGNDDKYPAKHAIDGNPATVSFSREDEWESKLMVYFKESNVHRINIDNGVESPYWNPSRWDYLQVKLYLGTKTVWVWNEWNGHSKISSSGLEVLHVADVNFPKSKGFVRQPDKSVRADRVQFLIPKNGYVQMAEVKVHGIRK